MLRIQRLKVEIATDNGIFGLDEDFNSGLNFIISKDNTCGKSSILVAIYYCLGFEEILGGKGEKALTAVFKTSIEDDEGVSWDVLQSRVFLEINNGKETITLYRMVKTENRDDKLITVYFGNLEAVLESNSNIYSIDTYVNMRNAAINEKGFHAFLEEFLHLQLPDVATTRGTHGKLYLQLIFSGMFIEQKHGWAGLFSGMPFLGIKESKKRVIEYILNLDTFETEKKREELKTLKNSVSMQWEKIVDEIAYESQRNLCDIINLPIEPQILSDVDLSNIYITIEGKSLNEEITYLEDEYKQLNKLKPKIIDNFKELQAELIKVENAIDEYMDMSKARKQTYKTEKEIVKVLEGNLNIIEMDLINNKDAEKLRSLGSDLACVSFDGVCPVCHQHIEDSLLTSSEYNYGFMSIAENIRHLEAQKQMIEYALKGHKNNISTLKEEVLKFEKHINTLTNFAQAIRSDLYSVGDNSSEAVAFQKISTRRRISELKDLEMFIGDKVELLLPLSDMWLEYQKEKKNLPSKHLTEKDEDKLSFFQKAFVERLKLYGYKSISNLNGITISEDTFLPLFEGFDVKFDSSASDNIRIIWAFTMALLKNSLYMKGNHPTLLIFDEPDQQSTVLNDMAAFFEDILSFGNDAQVIVAITIKDSETEELVKGFSKGGCNTIKIENKAFKKQIR